MKGGSARPSRSRQEEKNGILAVPHGASGKLVRSLFCITPNEFGVKGYSYFFERPDLSNGHLKKITGRNSFHFSLGPKFELAGKDLKLYNFKSFCLTFFTIFLLPILFFSTRRPAWRPPIPRTSTDPAPPAPPPGT